MTVPVNLGNKTVLKSFIEQLVHHFSWDLEGHFEQKFKGYETDDPNFVHHIFYFCYIRGDGKRKIKIKATHPELVSRIHSNECYGRYVIPWLEYCDIPYNVDYSFEDDDPDPGNEVKEETVTLGNVIAFKRK